MKIASEVLAEVQAIKTQAVPSPIPPASKMDRLKLIKELHERRYTESPEASEVADRPLELPSDKVPRGPAANRLLAAIKASGARPGDRVNPRQFAVAAGMAAGTASVQASELRARGLWPYEKVVPVVKPKPVVDEKPAVDEKEDDQVEGGDPGDLLLAAVERAGVRPGTRCDPADHAAAAGLTRSAALAAAWKLRRAGQWPYGEQAQSTAEPETLAVKVEVPAAVESARVEVDREGVGEARVRFVIGEPAAPPVEECPAVAIGDEIREAIGTNGPVHVSHNCAGEARQVVRPPVVEALRPAERLFLDAVGRSCQPGEVVGSRRAAEAAGVSRKVAERMIEKLRNLGAWPYKAGGGGAAAPRPRRPVVSDGGIGAELDAERQLLAALMVLPDWTTRRRVLRSLGERIAVQGN